MQKVLQITALRLLCESNTDYGTLILNWWLLSLSLALCLYVSLPACNIIQIICVWVAFTNEIAIAH